MGNNLNGFDALVCDTVIVMGSLSVEQELTDDVIELLGDLHGAWKAVAEAAGIDLTVEWKREAA